MSNQPAYLVQIFLPKESRRRRAALFSLSR
jgi:hypothetical protein